MVNKIILGDCLEVMKDIEEKSIDFICTDLPFGSTNCSWDSIIPFKPLWEHYLRITKQGSTIVLFGIGAFTAQVVNSNLKHYKYNLVWQKSKCGSPLLAKYRPMMKHEDIIVFTNGGGKHKSFNPQMEVGEPYSRTNVGIKLNNHGYGLKQVTTKNEGTRYPDSILDFPQKWRRQDQIHPTQKPIELMQYLIATYSDFGDMVLDSCFGSGSTILAAKYMARKYIGIEQDENYFNLLKEKL